MEPYFDTNHLAGLLLLLVALAWGTMELAKYSQGQSGRAGATRVRPVASRLAAAACILAATLMLHLGPRLVPAAAIRPAAVAFGVGIVIMVTGLTLRGWSIKTLGEYFTDTVMVSSDQEVVASGPYRLLRHPSYTGILLASVGVGLASANWISLAAMMLLPLLFIIWRIHVEENALLSALGEKYRSYAADHKRLVPVVW